MSSIINLKKPSLKELIIFITSFSAGFFVPTAFLNFVSHSVKEGMVNDSLNRYLGYVSYQGQIEDMKLSKALGIIAGWVLIIYLCGKAFKYGKSFSYGFLFGLVCRIVLTFVRPDVALTNVVLDSTKNMSVNTTANVTA